MKSMVNHLYWCAVSTYSGNDDEIKGKWISVCSHIQNILSGHCDEFPRCEHPALRGRGKKKKWIKPRKNSTYAMCLKVYVDTKED